MFNGITRGHAHIVRKIVKLKGSSTLKKSDLINLLNCNLCALIIQRNYRKFKLTSKICPFTLEEVSFPYYKKASQYYSLELLIGYLNASSNWSCPTTRAPFTKTDIKNINSIARNLKMSKVSARPKEKSPLAENTRIVIDSIIGDLIVLIEDSRVSTREMNRNINGRILNTLMPAYLVLRATDRQAAEDFCAQSICSLTTLADSLGHQRSLEKCQMATVFIMSLNEYGPQRHRPRRAYAIIDDLEI